MDTQAVTLVQQGHDMAVTPGSALLLGEQFNSYISYSADAYPQVVPAEIPLADIDMYTNDDVATFRALQPDHPDPPT